MKKVLLVALLGVFIMGLVGCGNNIPSATDSDVKSLVIQICTGELKNQLVGPAFLSVGNPNLGLASFSYSDLKSRGDAPKVIKKVDEQMAEITMELAAIRTKSVDDKIKKIRCSAELRFNSGKKIDIEYTAQYTEDGELYVEVFGLKN